MRERGARIEGLPAASSRHKSIGLRLATYDKLKQNFERLLRRSVAGRAIGGWADFQCDAWEDGGGGYVALCRGGGYHELLAGTWGIVAFEHPVDGEVDSIDSGAFPVAADDWLYLEWETDPDGAMIDVPTLHLGPEVPISDAVRPAQFFLSGSDDFETGGGTYFGDAGHYYRPIAQFVLAGQEEDTIRVQQYFTGGLVLYPDRRDPDAQALRDAAAANAENNPPGGNTGNAGK